MTFPASKTRDAEPVWVLSRDGPVKSLTLDRPRLLAILNITPDSFSDGGIHFSPHDAARAAAGFVAEGADAIDLGGESTRPGAPAINAAEQLDRVLPALRAIRRELGDSVPLTIDTTLATVAAAALDEGADAINDISAGGDDPEMFALAARRHAGIILMHRLTTPARDSYSDQYAAPPRYGPAGVVADVRAHLEARASAAARAGIVPDQIVLDPGLGFGKTVAQNLELIRRTDEIASLGFPVLSGVSRKSFTARVGQLPANARPQERLAPTLALSALHLCCGARIFRVHDVGPHAQALRAAWALLRDQDRSPISS